MLENLARNKILEEDKVKLIARDRGEEREKFVREVASESLSLIYICTLCKKESLKLNTLKRFRFDMIV